MIEIVVEIKNDEGLHARPAASFVKLASTFDADIAVSSGDESVNGKSILGVMILAAEKGRKLRVTATGADASDALKALKYLVEVEKFGEK